MASKSLGRRSLNAVAFAAAVIAVAIATGKWLSVDEQSAHWGQYDMSILATDRGIVSLLGVSREPGAMPLIDIMHIKMLPRDLSAHGEEIVSSIEREEVSERTVVRVESRRGAMVVVLGLREGGYCRINDFETRLANGNCFVVRLDSPGSPVVQLDVMCVDARSRQQHERIEKVFKDAGY